MNFTTATPAEIDTAWAEAIAPLHYKLSRAATLIQQAIGYQPKLDECIAKCGLNHYHGITQSQIDGWLTKGKEMHASATAELKAIEAPFHAEWVKRGGWTRAYKVTNGNGHIHSSMQCSTCNKRGIATSFYWVTELSGFDTDEIADRAGETACTICYPNAPVNKPTSIFTPDEKIKAAVKAEREATRAAKATKAAANAITQPDGQPLREKAGTGYVIKTVASAKQALNRAVSSVLSMEESLKRDGIDEGQIAHWTNLKVQDEIEVEYLLDAIAPKLGEDRDTLLAKSRKKAEKEWAASLKRAKAMGWV